MPTNTSPQYTIEVENEGHRQREATARATTSLESSNVAEQRRDELQARFKLRCGQDGEMMDEWE